MTALEPDVGQGEPTTDAMSINPSKVKKLYDDGAKDVRQEAAQAWVNRAFVGNRQWIFFDQSLGKIVDAPRQNVSRVRATINKVGPDSELVVAKMMRRPISFEVHPDAADDAAMRGARVAQAAVDDTRTRHNWEDLRLEHAWAAWETGTALLASDWDPTAGAALPDGQHEGDVSSLVLDVCEAVTVPGCRDIEHARWWIRAQAVPPDDVKAWYKLPAKPAADIRGTQSPVRQRYNDGNPDTELTLVLTYYERPNPENPQGAICTVADGRMLDGPHPWYFPYTDRLNISVARCRPVRHRWAGATPLSSAVDVQVLYNQAWSNIIEHLRNAGNARGIAPVGSIDDLSAMTDTPGEWTEVVPIGGFLPQYLEPPQLPQWVIEAPDKLAGAMDNILAVHDVSRGEAPANIESGLGLSILSENDDTPIGALAVMLGNAWARHARNVLELYEVKATETRTAIVYTNPRVPETINWTGSDFSGQTRVVVPTDSVIPRSRAAQQSFAMSMHDRFPDQLDVVKLAKIADLPDQDSLVDAVDTDTSKAQRENQYMAQGRPRLVARFDDHANHVMRHHDYMRSESFERLDPQVQNIFATHVEAHETVAAEEAAKSTLMQQAGMGGVPTADDPLPPSMPAAPTLPMQQPPPPGPMGMQPEDQGAPPGGPPPMETPPPMGQGGPPSV